MRSLNPRNSRCSPQDFPSTSSPQAEKSRKKTKDTVFGPSQFSLKHSVLFPNSFTFHCGLFFQEALSFRSPPTTAWRFSNLVRWSIHCGPHPSRPFFLHRRKWELWVSLSIRFGQNQRSSLKAKSSMWLFRRTASEVRATQKWETNFR